MINTKEYDKQISELGLEVERDLVVSTAHIKASDDEYFRELTCCKFVLSPTVIVTDFDYGWIVYVPTDEDNFKETVEHIKEDNQLSDGFLKLFELTHELKCNHIRIDRDGPISTSDKLKQYKW